MIDSPRTRYTPAGNSCTGCETREMNQRQFSALPPDPVVTMAYVPTQTDLTAYDEQKALECGTLFPCLNKPFSGRCAR